jgi:hypothetical protein
LRRIVPTLSSLLLLGALQGSALAQRSAKADPSVPRNNEGRIKRSEKAIDAFERQTGYPRGRPGYVIDHIVPLAKGGRDDPSNMQWQTKAAAKEKDKTERGQTPRASVPRSSKSGSSAKSFAVPRGGFGQSSRSAKS